MMAWNVLGLSLEGDGKLDEAITSYKEAVRLNRELKPQPAWPSLNLGTLLTKMERLKEGEKAFARFNELQAVRRGE